MQNGKIMSVDTPQNIIAAYPTKLYAARADNIYGLLNDFRKDEQVDSSFPFGEYLHITLKNDNGEGVHQLKEYAEQHNHQHLEIKIIQPTIEDSFIRLMNENKLN